MRSSRTEIWAPPRKKAAPPESTPPVDLALSSPPQQPVTLTSQLQLA